MLLLGSKQSSQPVGAKQWIVLQLITIQFRSKQSSNPVRTKWQTVVWMMTIPLGSKQSSLCSRISIFSPPRAIGIQLVMHIATAAAPGILPRRVHMQEKWSVLLNWLPSTSLLYKLYEWEWPTETFQFVEGEDIRSGKPCTSSMQAHSVDLLNWMS